MIKFNSAAFFGLYLFVFLLVVFFYLVGESVFYYVLYFSVSLIFLNGRSFSVREYDVYIFSFVFLSALSCLLSWHHSIYYGDFFDAYGDDRRFFNWAINILNGGQHASYSVYEYLIAGIFFVFQAIGVEANPHQVIALNVATGSFVVMYAHRLARVVTDVDLPVMVPLILVVLNYTFSQNVVHLYRDVYVSFFSILFVLFLYEGRRFSALTVLVLVSLFRPPVAIYLSVAYFLYEFTRLKWSSWIRLGLAFLIFIILIAGMSFSGFTVSKYDLSDPLGIVVSRVEKFDRESDISGGGMSAVNNLVAPVRFFVNHFVQPLRPVKINALDSPVRESLAGSDIFNHVAFGNMITTVTLFFFAGSLFLGSVLSLFLWFDKLKLFNSYFLVTVFVLGFFSYLDRHRIAIIPFFPTLYAVVLRYYYHVNFLRLINRRFLIFMLNFVFVAAVVVVSL